MISAKAIWTDNERYVAEATSRHAIVMDTANEKTANTPDGAGAHRSSAAARHLT